jgi:hypothetical protein
MTSVIGIAIMSRIETCSPMLVMLPLDANPGTPNIAATASTPLAATIDGTGRRFRITLILSALASMI